MIFIDNEDNLDPHLNLAIEEYALRNFSEATNYLLFYINEPSIIIGRNQNTLEEINKQYIDDKGIKVVRRISGGGAVYHDHGNLNFSFITDYAYKSLNNFKLFVGPIIEVLREMGVDAEMSGRNDILASGRKISGNAQFSSRNRMFSHGTLLYNSDLSEVSQALNVKMSKIQSKGHKSVRSRVANISEFLESPMSTEEFRDRLLRGLTRKTPNFRTHRLTDEEWAGVYELKAKKYDTWDWNYGQSPKFNVQRIKRFDIGEVDLRIDVARGGLIENIKIYGDFLGKDPVSDIEERLMNVRYDKGAITQALHDIDTKMYFGNLEKEDFINLLYGEDEDGHIEIPT